MLRSKSLLVDMQVLVINLVEMLENYGEQTTLSFLSTFSSPLNKDVEEFLHHKAIDFTKQRISITYLVISLVSGDVEINGYYALANKVISIPLYNISKTLQKKIGKFSQYDPTQNIFFTSMPLIAQLGRNFSCKKSFVSGGDILALACNTVQNVQKQIGGKSTYIECAQSAKLINFYMRNGFVQFCDCGTYVQMLKYLR